MRKLTPGRYLLIGFAVIILIGTFLLMLPQAQTGEAPTTFQDALFTATSAVCVTGLSTVTTAAHWTTFGQVTILCLIEVGGLGFMSFTTMFLILLRKKISLTSRLRIQESLNQDMLSGGVRLMKRIFLASLGIQAVGALLLMIRFIPDYGSRGIYYGIFHSISAFCNAGFDLIGSESLIPYGTDVYVTMVLSALIVLGGLGFFVWWDVSRMIRKRRKKRTPYRRLIHELTLQSKVVISMTVALLILGMVLVLILEWNNPDTLGAHPWYDRFTLAGFESVTLRTAGFFSFDQGAMKDATKFLASLMMFVGACSGGTAGGIKVATIGVLFLAIRSEVTGEEYTHVFGRQIAASVIRKALAIFGISFAGLLLCTILVSTQETFSFIDVFYESASAMSTTGLSTGITAGLSVFSKYVIIIAMYIGRTGSLTLAGALQRKRSVSGSDTIRYPDESLMVG